MQFPCAVFPLYVVICSGFINYPESNLSRMWLNLIQPTPKDDNPPYANLSFLCTQTLEEQSLQVIRELMAPLGLHLPSWRKLKQDSIQGNLLHGLKEKEFFFSFLNQILLFVSVYSPKLKDNSPFFLFYHMESIILSQN